MGVRTWMSFTGSRPKRCGMRLVTSSRTRSAADSGSLREST
jgi:hypothetical protein